MNKKNIFSVFVYDERYPFGEETEDLIRQLKNICGKICIYGKKTENFSDDISVYRDIDAINALITEEYGWVLVFDNSFFGPLCPVENIFTQMGGSLCDYWGLEEYRIFDGQADGKRWEKHVRPYFICFRKAMFQDTEVLSFIKKNDFRLSDSCNAFFVSKGYAGSALYINNYETNGIFEDESLIRPYDMLKQNRICVIHKDVFRMQRTERLEHDLCDQVYKMIRYLKTESDYPFQYIRNFLLDHFTPTENKNLLNLNLIFNPDEHFPMADISLYDKTAIAMHLYYPGLFEKCIEYIRNIPEEIHLFITVKSEDDRSLFLRKAGERKKIKVIVASNIGRDWGAYILDLWSEVKEYEYLCFLHDKKTTGGKHYTSVGKAFMDLDWECLLAGKDYINKVLIVLAENPSLGLLSPNIPYHGVYEVLLWNAWTFCYQSARELADKMGLDVPMRRDSMPFAMSSMFWCRKEAVLPIFEYGFEKDDFPKEPMPTDGTLNHVLERLVIYSAQSRRYFSGVLQTIDIATNTMLNYEAMLSEKINKNKENGISPGIRAEIIRFAADCCRLYIYGAGNCGRKVAALLERYGITFEGFIVSERFVKEENYCGHQVWYLSELGRNIQIIVAVDVKYQEEVVGYLKSGGFQQYIVLR